MEKHYRMQSHRKPKLGFQAKQSPCKIYLYDKGSEKSGRFFAAQNKNQVTTFTFKKV